MKRNIDEYLKLDAFQIDLAIQKANSVIEVWKLLGLTPLRANRGLEIFEAKFGSISAKLLQKRKSKQEALKQIEFQTLRKCANPKCGKTFTWKDRPPHRCGCHLLSKLTEVESED